MLAEDDDVVLRAAVAGVTEARSATANAFRPSARRISA